MCKTIKFGSLEWWILQFITLVFFYLIFVFGRVVFILWNFNELNASFFELYQTFVYGFRLDISLAAFSALIVTFFSPFLFIDRLYKYVYPVVVGLLLFVYLSIIFVDAELYTYWGYKIDPSVLKYLLTPKEAIASLSYLRLFFLGLLFLCVIISIVQFVIRFVPKVRLSFRRLWQLNGLLVLPLLFLLGRGTIDVSGVNVSTAFFSQKQVLNHAAINAPWNFSESLFANQHKLQLTWNDSLKHHLSRFESNIDSTVSILKDKKANLVIVVMESFTANLLDYEVNGQSPVPNLKRIASEAYFFPNCYATGGRSDKGLGALFSGFPAHPHGSILKYPEKYGLIGHFASAFVAAGYQTRFYYGGNSDFANFKGFLISCGFQKVVEQSDFSIRQRTSKWGVQDDIVMDRFFDDIKNAPTPFLYSVFTLSSHEPFEVSYNSSFIDGTKRGDYLNSVAFTDSVIGHFYDQFKKSPVWENSLVVFVADHGHSFPIMCRHEEPSYYRIPLIVTGGALRNEFRSSENKSLLSQIDIPRTLLQQFELPVINFPFSRNFMTKNFAAPLGYIFNFGYGVVTPTADTVVFDVGGDRLFHYGIKDSTWVQSSNAWFQFVLKSFE